MICIVTETAEMLMNISMVTLILLEVIQQGGEDDSGHKDPLWYSRN